MPDPITAAADNVSRFHDAPSQSGRATGEATGGADFERAVAAGLTGFIASLGTQRDVELFRAQPAAEGPPPGLAPTLRPIVGAAKDNRSVIWCVPHLGLHPELERPIRDSWLQKDFAVETWYDPYLGALASRGWIPTRDDDTPYHGPAYPDIYRGKKMHFDGVILFVESDRLSKKVFLEVKSAKSSRGGAMDANVHERFAFQNLEYLELATLYPSTQLLLLTNGVYTRYRNKYHTGFGVHAVRLGNAFGWYNFDLISSKSQYVRLFRGWKSWLLND